MNDGPDLGELSANLIFYRGDDGLGIRLWNFRRVDFHADLFLFFFPASASTRCRFILSKRDVDVAKRHF
jgi:hypothetical protein